MLIDTFREFVISGIESDEFDEHRNLLGALVLIKWMTLMDDMNAGLSKVERKKVTGITIPHTANYHYIMKHIESDKLLGIINDALIKVEKSNLKYKGEVALRKINISFTFDGKKDPSNESVIKNLEEVSINKELLSQLLLEIDNMSEQHQFKEVEDFLFNGANELLDERLEFSQQEFEKNRKIVFKGDVPISINNSAIFDKTFIVEQWIRKIIMFVLMTEYGSNWIKVFEDDDLKEYEWKRRKMKGREVIDRKDDHLLWYSTIGYLAGFVKKEDMKEMIEKTVGVKTDTLSEAIYKVGDIRNEMAHNRTITKVMEEDYQKNFDILENAIIHFKGSTLYSNGGNIISGSFYNTEKDSEFTQYFNKEYAKNYKAHAFVAENKSFYAIVFLNCDVLGAEYIDIGILLDNFAAHRDHIIAFYVNMLMGEYQITVTKDIGRNKVVHRSIVKTFFDSIRDLGTDVPYEHQDPKFTCNPKIWFYENSHEEGLKSKLW